VDPAGLLAAAAPFLAQDELANGFLLARLTQAATGTAPGARGFLVETAREVAFAALWQPGSKLFISEGGVAACAALAKFLAARAPALTGVFGPQAAAEVFAAHFGRQAAARVVPLVTDVVYRLERVEEAAARGASGRMRLGTAAERALIEAWLAAFVPEARLSDSVDVPGVVAGALVRGSVFLWDVAGVPAAMAWHVGATPNGARLGMVYTPVAGRGRGYGTALVAALSGHLLGAGHRFCSLLADADNPVSNRLYERVGYRAVGRACELAFRPAAT
jgi:predicted GNAT family acetyltransferase